MNIEISRENGTHKEKQTMLDQGSKVVRKGFVHPQQEKARNVLCTTGNSQKRAAGLLHPRVLKDTVLGVPFVP